MRLLKTSCASVLLSIVFLSDLHSDGVSSTTGTIIFDVNGDSTEEMVLSAGNLGIGTSSPAANLHVNGNAVISQALAIGQTSLSSNLTLSGSMGMSCLSSNVSVSSPLHSQVLMDTSSANISLTLPLASSAMGRMYTVKKTVAAGRLTVSPSGSDNIDGKLFMDLTTNSSNASLPHLSLLSNGSNWFVLNRSSSGVSSTPSDASSLLWSDNFDDNSLDAALWSVGAGSPSETSGVMRLNPTGSASRLESVKALNMSSDATVIVDWSAFTYDVNAEASLELHGSDWSFKLMRRKFGYTDVNCRVSSSGGNVVDSNSTTSATGGKFMAHFVASSGVVTGYWNNGDTWEELLSSSGNALGTGSGITVRLRLWGSAAASIDYDNLRAYGTLGP